MDQLGLMVASVLLYILFITCVIEMDQLGLMVASVLLYSGVIM